MNLHTSDNGPENILTDLKPEYDFFIGIDSDGCVFDTMELKQKECFCPNFIKYWDLQPISKYAREVWEFVNLYSSSRGVNRFIALVKAIRMLAERKEVQRRNFRLPEVTDIEVWIEKETKLGNPALEQYARKVQSDAINRALLWTKAVNEDIADMVRGVAPFPFVKDSLVKLKGMADLIVVSQTPVEALEREWRDHGLDKYVRLMAGQEYGTKAEHLKLAAGSKYEKEKILMVGDAPGDLLAARENGILFYPVIPEKEEYSWEEFYREAIPRFFSGRYQGDYQEERIEEFNEHLPETPPWDT